MNHIWRETIVNCPIHGRQITKIPLYQQNFNTNTNNYAYKNMINYNTYETERNYNNNYTNLYYNNNKNRRQYINSNINRNQNINNNYNKNISLSNAYKSSLNNPVKIYGNSNSKYTLKNNADSSRNQPLNIKNTFNRNDNNYRERKNNYSYNRNTVQIQNYNKINPIEKRESKASYRRRNEKDSNNLEQKNISNDKMYKRDRKNNYSYDIKDVNQIDNGYNNNNTFSNNNISIATNQRKERTQLNNGIKGYSSKTNDVINRRILITEQKNLTERNINSIVVNSSDLNNYKFYVSRDNYLNSNKMPYSVYTQPTLPIKREYMRRNEYNKVINTDYYDDYKYNNNSYYEINHYMNKMDNKYDYNDNGGLIEYNKPSPMNNNYYYQVETSSVPVIKRKQKDYNIPNDNETDKDYANNVNNMKKKKKIVKHKVHDLKEKRENEFKIEKSYNMDDENTEEHVEKYFDKDGNCIGGKKIIIKQEYDNGQKIIKKFVEEKYKSNSDYEILKRQGENNYNNPIKNQEKKETIITSTIKSSDNNTLEVNPEEENNNLNTIVTFGMNSKNSKLEEELELNNINEEKEPDEQTIEINSEFEEEENEEMEKNEENNNKDEEKEERKSINDENNDREESEKSPEEDNNFAILEGINQENGGINNEIKDINEERDIHIQDENENNLDNINLEEYEKEEYIDE